MQRILLSFLILIAYIGAAGQGQTEIQLSPIFSDHIVWKSVTPSTVKDLSAIAYFFARDLQGMACTIDIEDPDNIHPKNKLDVGKRLYLAARKVAYGENIVYSGPVYESMRVEGELIRLKFSSTGNGLTTRNNEPLKGFSIAGNDHKFYWADATIKGNEVVVSSVKIKSPDSVRYSWESNPDGNLYNKEGLPAPPFRTDHLKMITQ